MKQTLMLILLTVGSLHIAAQCSASKKGDAQAANTSHDQVRSGFAGNSGAYTKNIVETAVDAGSFKTLAAALGAAGLADVLQGDGPFTVFAPTDEAFAKLPKGTVESLLLPENKDRLIQILTYHVVPGRVPASKVVGLSNAATVNGQQVTINTTSGVMIDNAKVIKTDVEASNGIIHVIDNVILPTDKNLVEVAADAGDFGTLITAVKAAGLDGLLAGDGPFTVFAPTDAAFGKLPKGTIANLLKPENRHQLADILKLHVVPGRVFAKDAINANQADSALGQKLRFSVEDGHVRVNGAKIVATDVQADNGVIHVIDGVLLPK